MTRSQLGWFAAALLALAPAGAQAQISDDLVKIGVLTDMTGYYSDLAGAGSVLKIGPDGNPEQNGTINAPFTAIIPCSLSTGPTSGRPIVYGHGLLGTGAGEVTSGHLRNLSQTYGFVVAATDWQGMANEDILNILTITSDLTNFRQLSERLHQGILNTLVLAHLMGAPDGFAADPNFIYGGVPVID